MHAAMPYPSSCCAQSACRRHAGQPCIVVTCAQLASPALVIGHPGIACLQVLDRKDDRKAFDWASPTAPGPTEGRSPPPPAASEPASKGEASAGNGGDGSGGAAQAEPASPTIALLDALLDTPPPAPPTTTAAASQSAAAAASEDGSSSADTVAPQAVATADGGAAGAEVGPRTGAGQGEGASEQAVLDLAPPVVGWSVLASFGVSLAVLAWAGCVVGPSSGAGPMM